MGQVFSNCIGDEDERSPEFPSIESAGFNGDVWLPDDETMKKSGDDSSKEYAMKKEIDHEGETDTSNMDNPSMIFLHTENKKETYVKNDHETVRDKNDIEYREKGFCNSNMEEIPGNCSRNSGEESPNLRRIIVPISTLDANDEDILEPSLYLQDCNGPMKNEGNDSDLISMDRTDDPSHEWHPLVTTFDADENEEDTSEISSLMKAIDEEGESSLQDIRDISPKYCSLQPVSTFDNDEKVNISENSLHLQHGEDHGSVQDRNDRERMEAGCCKSTEEQTLERISPKCCSLVTSFETVSTFDADDDVNISETLLHVQDGKDHGSIQDRSDREPAEGGCCESTDEQTLPDSLEDIREISPKCCSLETVSTFDADVKVDTLETSFLLQDETYNGSIQDGNEREPVVKGCCESIKEQTLKELSPKCCSVVTVSSFDADDKSDISETLLSLGKDHGSIQDKNVTDSVDNEDISDSLSHEQDETDHESIQNRNDREPCVEEISPKCCSLVTSLETMYTFGADDKTTISETSLHVRDGKDHGSIQDMNDVVPVEEVCCCETTEEKSLPDSLDDIRAISPKSCYLKTLSDFYVDNKVNISETPSDVQDGKDHGLIQAGEPAEEAWCASTEKQTLPDSLENTGEISPKCCHLETVSALDANDKANTSKTSLHLQDGRDHVSIRDRNDREPVVEDCCESTEKQILLDSHEGIREISPKCCSLVTSLETMCTFGADDKTTISEILSHIQNRKDHGSIHDINDREPLEEGSCKSTEEQALLDSLDDTREIFPKCCSLVTSLETMYTFDADDKAAISETSIRVQNGKDYGSVQDKNDIEPVDKGYCESTEEQGLTQKFSKCCSLETVSTLDADNKIDISETSLHLQDGKDHVLIQDRKYIIPVEEGCCESAEEETLPDFPEDIREMSPGSCSLETVSAFDADNKVNISDTLSHEQDIKDHVLIQNRNDREPVEEGCSESTEEQALREISPKCCSLVTSLETVYIFDGDNEVDISESLLHMQNIKYHGSIQNINVLEPVDEGCSESVEEQVLLEAFEDTREISRKCCSLETVSTIDVDNKVDISYPLSHVQQYGKDHGSIHDRNEREPTEEACFESTEEQTLREIFPKHCSLETAPTFDADDNADISETLPIQDGDDRMPVEEGYYDKTEEQTLPYSLINIRDISPKSCYVATSLQTEFAIYVDDKTDILETPSDVQVGKDNGIQAGEPAEDACCVSTQEQTVEGISAKCCSVVTPLETVPKFDADAMMDVSKTSLHELDGEDHGLIKDSTGREPLEEYYCEIIDKQTSQQISSKCFHLVTPLEAVSTLEADDNADILETSIYCQDGKDHGSILYRNDGEPLEEDCCESTEEHTLEEISPKCCFLETAPTFDTDDNANISETILHLQDVKDHGSFEDINDIEPLEEGYCVRTEEHTLEEISLKCPSLETAPFFDTDYNWNISETSLRVQDGKDHGSIEDINDREPLEEGCCDSTEEHPLPDSLEDIREISPNCCSVETVSNSDSDDMVDILGTALHLQDGQDSEKKSENDCGVIFQKRLDVVKNDGNRNANTSNMIYRNTGCLRIKKIEDDVKSWRRTSCNSIMDHIFADSIKHMGGKAAKLRLAETFSTFDTDEDEDLLEIEDELGDNCESVKGKIKLFEKKIAKVGVVCSFNSMVQTCDRRKSLKSHPIESKSILDANDEVDGLDNSVCLKDCHITRQLGDNSDVIFRSRSRSHDSRSTLETMDNSDSSMVTRMIEDDVVTHTSSLCNPNTGSLCTEGNKDEIEYEKLSVQDIVQNLEEKIELECQQTEITLTDDISKSDSKKVRTRLSLNSYSVKPKKVIGVNNVPRPCPLSDNKNRRRNTTSKMNPGQLRGYY